MVGTWGGFNKYLFLGSFFHLTQLPLWITFIYGRGGSGRGGGGGRVGGRWVTGSRRICFFLPGGLWGVLNKFEHKSRGVEAKYNFFFYNFPPDYFFSNGRVRQVGG